MRSIIVLVLSALILSGCTSRSVDKTLYDIESYIMEHPDSALIILDTMNRNILKSERQRAHHALLHAMALDKNYIDVSDDSIARVAVDYYSKRGPEKYEARSLYYLGLAYYYQKKYDKAILEFTKAEEVARKSDSLYLGFVKMGQADSYAKTYNDIEELKSIKETYDICLKLKEPYYINASKLRLAQALINLKDYKKADSLLLELIESENNDIEIRISAMVTYAFRNTLYDDINYNEAINIYSKIIKEYDGLFMKNKDYWAYAYSLSKVGRKEEAQNILTQLNNVDTSGTADYWMYLIEKSIGNYEDALKYLEKSTNKIDKEVTEALQQSLALSQRDYYKSEFENAEYKARNRKLIAISVGVSSVLVLVLLLWATSVYVRRQREEKEYYLNYANEVRRQLEAAKKEDYPQLQRKYLEIYKSKFEMIGSLYEEYVLYRGKKNAEHAIYSKVSEIINAFIGDNANQHQLESVLDDSLDGIVSTLRKEMPRLKEIDYSIFCYVLIGFDATTISHLLNITTNVVYIRRSRMKQHIEDVAPKHKDQFLNILR